MTSRPLSRHFSGLGSFFLQLMKAAFSARQAAPMCFHDAISTADVGIGSPAGSTTAPLLLAILLTLPTPYPMKKKDAKIRVNQDSLGFQGLRPCEARRWRVFTERMGNAPLVSRRRRPGSGSSSAGEMPPSPPINISNLFRPETFHAINTGPRRAGLGSGSGPAHFKEIPTKFKCKIA